MYFLLLLTVTLLIKENATFLILKIVVPETEKELKSLSKAKNKYFYLRNGKMCNNSDNLEIASNSSNEKKRS